MTREEVSELSDKKIGRLLYMVGEAEIYMNAFILKHFLWDDEDDSKREDFVKIVLQEGRIGLDSKADMIHKIMKKHFPDEIKYVPYQLLKDFVKWRNILAHSAYLLDVKLPGEPYSIDDSLLLRSFDKTIKLTEAEDSIVKIVGKLYEGFGKTTYLKQFVALNLRRRE